MQILLIAITVIASLAAAAMSIVVIRVLREERRRSDARVEALAALVGDVGPALATGAGAATPARTGSPILGHETPVEIAFADEAARAAGPRSRRISGALPDTAAAVPDARPGLLFGQDRAVGSPWRRRLGVAAVLGAIGVAGALAVGTGAPSGPAASAAAGSPPLELLSLRHAFDEGALTITGLVQNPRGARALAGVAVVAHLLDRDGRTIATANGLLDFRRLDAGAESPFVLTVAAAAGVDRYRIGFRDAAGGVIAHVDRRSADRIVRRD